jgi:hypothetical protein
VQFIRHAEPPGEFGLEAMKIGTGERGLIQAGSRLSVGLRLRLFVALRPDG